jgi:signal transduction histidine kinase
MFLLALTVIAVAALLARRQARRIALPLERLTVAARALGDGNFAINPERSGIAEADAAGAALGETAARLGNLLERERAFSADASHQLRTPLTGLLLGLESAMERPDADLRLAIADALDRGRRLQGTVDDLLTLRRDAPTAIGSIDLGAELSKVERQWRPVLAAQGRRLTVTTRAPAAATGSPAAVRQILDVLIDNALKHGAGEVTITTGELGDALAVEVTDEGRGLQGDPEEAFVRRFQGDGGHGIGLALARSLAEADGGRLVVRHVAPRPVFALLLPLADTFVASRRHGGSPQASSS